MKTADVTPIDVPVPIDEQPSIVSREGYRWYELIINIFAVVGVVAIILFPSIIVFCIAPPVLCVYIVTMYCTNDLNLSNVKNRESCMEKMRSLVDMPPILYMTVDCWHDEPGGDGTYRLDTYTKTETFYYDTFTFKYSEAFKNHETALAFNLVRLHVRDIIVIVDSYTATKYIEQRDILLNANRTRDRNIDYRASFITPGFEPVILVFSDESRLPWWMNNTCHFITVLFLCGWLFRMAVQWFSVKIEICMEKRVSRTMRYFT